MISYGYGYPPLLNTEKTHKNILVFPNHKLYFYDTYFTKNMILVTRLLMRSQFVIIERASTCYARKI